MAAAIRTQKDVLSRGRKSEYRGPNASPKGAAHEVFSLREAVHGDGSMRTVVLGSVTCGFNTQMRRQEGQHSGRRLQVTTGQRT